MSDDKDPTLRETAMGFVFTQRFGLALDALRQIADAPGGADVRAIADRALSTIEAVGGDTGRQLTEPPRVEPLSEEAQKAVLSGEVDLDGHVDLKGVKYIGKATRQPDGTWRCLAEVGSALCIVEVRITFQPSQENP